MKLISKLLMLAGTIAGFGNYLWLIGLSAKPEQSLLDARWIYACTVWAVAGMILVIDHERKGGR